MKYQKQLGDKNTIGAKITKFREAQGMKQKELMAQLQTRGVDIGQSNLSQLEGQHRAVTGAELIALAEIFGITAEELFYGEKDT